MERWNPESIWVILPTLNEEGNVDEIIRRTLNCLDCQILFIDDDSGDGTWEKVGKFCLEDKRVRLLRRKDRKGLTSAIQEGIDFACSNGASAVCWMDADLSMPPEAIPSLVEALKVCDIAIGSRFVEGGCDERKELLQRIFSRIICALSSAVLDSSVKDYTSGFVAARSSFIKGFKLRGDYGEYCIDLIIRAKMQGARIKELPYRYVSRVSGTTKTSPTLFEYSKKGVLYLRMVWDLFLTGKKARK